MVKDNIDESKGSNSKKWVAIGIALLIVIAGVCWFLSRDKGGLKEGTVIIKAADKTLGSFTVADLQKLPSVEKNIVIPSNCNGACKPDNSGGNEEHLYTAVPLQQVMDSIDPAMTRNYKLVITKGIDYYSQVMNMAEITKPDDVYVVYSDYGKPLKTKTNEEGILQLIVCSDQSGQRFTKYLVSLDLQ